jgi:hypothetical protein
MRFLASPLAMSAVLIAATLAACAHPLSMRDIDAAIGARDASQWSEFQSRMRAISARHPGQPTFRYLLAQAAARNDDDFAAIEQLRWLGERGYSHAAWTHPAFERLRSSAAFIEAAARLDANAKIEVGQSSLTLTIDREDIRPEGVEFDARQGRFLVSSLLDGSLYGVSTSGVATEVWRERRAGRESAGVRLAPDLGDRIMLCSNSGSAGAEIIQIESETGRQLRRIALPRSRDSGNYCNDIAALGDRGFAVTDSERGMIWRIDRDLTAVTPLLDEGSLLYPNGIAASIGGEVLYVADMLGVSMITVQSGHMRRFEIVDDLTLAAIDGLYLTAGKLVGVQNAISPERIIEIRLGPDRRPNAARVIAQGASLTDMTTAVVGRDGIFVLSRTGVGHGSRQDENAFPQIREVSPKTHGNVRPRAWSEPVR